MNIEILESTPNPDELMCRAARNDYGADATGKIHEVLEPIDATEEDYEWAESFLEEYGNAFEPIIETWAKKRRLIRKLFNRGHFGVAEHPTATFAIQGVSRALMAQLTRHRHASFDIMSMRYVEMDEPDVYEPPEIDSAEPTGRGAEFDSFIKENSTDEDIAQMRKENFDIAVETSYRQYQSLLNQGVAPEHARMVLPIGTKVDVVMTVNVRTLLHIADMRAAADAQGEIRRMTEEILRVAEEWCPVGISTYKEEMKGRKNRLSP